MPLKAPELDSRKFDDIFREARQRIPRYAPEWTDFNDSDPGITLLQLYAWLTEMMLYQMNRVPERNYLKFLELLGMELEPAQPATAHLTFTAGAGAAAEPVRRGSQIGAESADGELLTFETDQGLSLIPLPLASVQVFDGTTFQDVTAANETENAPFYPLGWRAQPGSALCLGFAEVELASGLRPFPRELRLRVFLPPGSEQAGVERSGAPRPQPPVTLEWQYLPGEGSRWRHLDLYKDESLAFTREGYLVVEGPSRIEPARVSRVAEPHYWLRCRLAKGSYPQGRAPRIELLRPNTVPARNLTTRRGEILGESEGVPDQSFELRHKPVVPASLSLWVEPPAGDAEVWRRVDDLLASAGDAADYSLSATAGTVRFGDGSHGRIPAAGAEIVAREYRYGGGKAGNVGAGWISTPLTSLTGVEKVENLRAAVGGRDEQSVEELKRRAPAALRHRGRAVSAEDFEALAAEAGGVARAKAIALAHPDYRGEEPVEVPGAVTVVIVPDSDEVPPKASLALLRHVSDYLDDFRLIGSEVFVRRPLFLEVRVEALLTARPEAASGAVIRDVAAALEKYLDPHRWPFGADLHPTRFYDVILDVDDVVSVKTLQLVVDGRPHVGLNEPVIVSDDGLIYGTGHRIVVRPHTDRSAV